MAKSAKRSADGDLNREIHQFSMVALELAKQVADGSVSDENRAKAKELADQLPDIAAKARELSDAYRVGASKTLADARLDLAYVAADGGVPSSTRLGWYIKERGDEPGQ